MPDPLTVNKGFDLQSTGENSNTWGTVLNGIFTDIDTALGGVTTIAITGVAAGNYALTLTQYTPPIIEFSGVLSGNLTYSLPAGVGGYWSIFNGTSGAFTLSWGSNGGGSSVALPQNKSTLVACNGVNVFPAQTGVTSANPVALVGTSPVNGTLSTYMTSDSAPAIDQTMSPTWTGIHNFTGGVRLESPTNLIATMTLSAGAEIDAVTNAAAIVAVTQPTGGAGSPNVATTAYVLNALAASPALGGNPTATTQSAGTSSTLIASTAFVHAVIAALPTLAGNSSNGSLTIGSLIVNYGILTTPGSSPTTVSYTTPYTTAVFAVVPYLVGANQTYFVGTGFGTSLSNWSLNFGASGQAVGWIAIGR